MKLTKRTVAQFLKGSKALLLGLKEDDQTKSKLTSFNYDEAKLDAGIAIFNEAEKMESEKSRLFGLQLEAKASYNLARREAEKVYRKHKDFLLLVCREDIEMKQKLMPTDTPRAKRIADWFKYVIELYDRVLIDEKALGALSKYAITKEELEAAKQKIQAADTAKMKHSWVRSAAKTATAGRNEAFKKLKVVIDELTTICYHALQEDLQFIELFGIPSLSVNYKRKRKSKKQVNPEPQVIPVQPEVETVPTVRVKKAT